MARRHSNYSGFDSALCAQSKCLMREGLNPDYLHLDIAGEGSAWVFIKNEHANIGLGLPRKSCSPESLKRHLYKYMERLGIKPLGKTVAAAVAIDRS